MQLGVTFGIANIVVPAGGPKCVPLLNVDFSNVSSIIIDGSEIVQRGQIEYIQGVFIDNSANAANLSLTMSTTGQVIVAPKKSQGYYSILAPNPPQMTAATPQVNGLLVPMIFYNVPIQPVVWSVA